MKRNLLGAALAIIYLQPVGSMADECSADKNKTGEVKGAYSLTFHSWSWRDKNDLLYCHCVRNQGKVVTWVEWDKTSVSGYIPNRDFIFVQSHALGELEPKMATLWYGAKPEKISVKTMLAKQAAPASSEKLTIETKAKFFVPDISLSDKAAAGSTVTLKQVARAIQNNPGTLQQVSMKYEAIPEFNEKGALTGIRHRCTYTMHGSSWNEQLFRMEIADREINDKVFKQDPHFAPITSHLRLKYEGLVSTEGESLGDLKKSNSELRVVLTGTDLVVARIPVTVYTTQKEDVASIL